MLFKDSLSSVDHPGRTASRRKLLTGAVIAATIAALLAGCGGSKKTSSPQSAASRAAATPLLHPGAVRGCFEVAVTMDRIASNNDIEWSNHTEERLIGETLKPGFGSLQVSFGGASSSDYGIGGINLYFLPNVSEAKAAANALSGANVDAAVETRSNAVVEYDSAEPDQRQRDLVEQCFGNPGS